MRFFQINEHAQVDIKTWEIISSLAEHYSKGIRGARCLVNPLQKMLATCEATGNPFFRKKALPAAKFCIEMWRVLSVILYFFPHLVEIPICYLAGRYSGPHPFYSWLPMPAQGCGCRSISDSSPTKIYAAITTPSG